MQKSLDAMFIDTHAHIYAKEFDEDRSEILEKTLNQGIGKIFMPNVDHSSIDRMLETEEKNPGLCIPMMGLHPCSVKKHFEKELYEVEDWLKKRKFAAVGEIGIDLYWDKTFKSQQEEAFRIQAHLAVQHDLPIVIHTRNATRETIDLIQDLELENLTGIFHCFSGTIDEAIEILQLGFYLGIGGVATFKNGGLDKVLPDLSLDRLVLETDCPYLAPMPHRGKRNEPSYIPLIANRVAEILKKDVEEVEEKTTENALKIFRS